MRIHKEGYKIIVYTTISLVALNLILFRLSGKSLLFYFILSLSVGLFLVILNFFRSPCRAVANPSDNLIIAPADGTIVVVEEVEENEYFQGKKIQVSIFMSLFNAHVNWIPCNGIVKQVFYQKGRFRAAYLPKSSTENERSSIVIESRNGEEILVRQIAGAMAKRIRTYAKPGDTCHINDQLGFIKFGSRVDLFLPPDSEILIGMHQNVKGNHTAIARLK